MWEKLLKFVSLRPRSEKEVKIWFLRKKVPQKKQERYFIRLKRTGLLDDTKFAYWWVEQRSLFRPRSRKYLFAELLQKGVARQIIQEAVARVDEEEAALRLAKKRGSKEIEQYLARQGFDWEVIKKVKLSLGEKKDGRNR